MSSRPLYDNDGNVIGGTNLPIPNGDKHLFTQEESVSSVAEIPTPRIHDVLGYQAVEAGDRIEFWDGGEDLLFSVPAEAAATQVRREALIGAYLAGREAGESCGRFKLQYEFRRLLNFSQ